MSQQEQDRRCPGCGVAQKRHEDCWLDLSCSNHAAACPWYKAFCSVSGTSNDPAQAVARWRDDWNPQIGDWVVQLTCPIGTPYQVKYSDWFTDACNRKRYHRPAWPDEIAAAAARQQAHEHNSKITKWRIQDKPAAPAGAALQPSPAEVPLPPDPITDEDLRRAAALATLENQHHQKEKKPCV